MEYPPSGGGGSSGTVTGVSVAAANGFSGSVATATTTPAITLSTSITGILKGNGTAVSTAAYADLPAPTAGSISNSMLANAAVANLSGTNTGDQTNITGNAATVTTNANLTGVVTSVGNATSFAASPAFVTPLLGTPTSGVLTNCTGTAAGLTAGNVTTNANLTGVVTSVGNVTSFAASPTFTGTLTAAIVTASGAVTVSAAGATAVPGLALTGAILQASATGTAQLLIQPSAATAITTLSANGTAIAVNLASGSTANFLDFHINNAASVVSLSSAGNLSLPTISVTSSILMAGAGLYKFSGSSVISAPSNGKILLQNAAQTAFTSLQFGGTSASFPEIKVNGTAFNFRLADDSTDCAITCAAITISGLPKFAGTNSTGAGSAALGANSPAVTNTAPYTWISATSSDGSAVFIPCWK